MAVAKILPSGDFIYGGSTICPKEGSAVGTFFHAPADRVIDIPDDSGDFFLRNDGRFRGDNWLTPGAISANSGDFAQNASGDAVVYFPAEKYLSQAIYGAAFEYSATPGSGFLRIDSPSGVPVFGPVGISSAGMGFQDFDMGLKGGRNKDMLIVLGGGGAGVTGSLSIKGHRKE